MSKTLTRWRQDHPTFLANQAGQALKERLRVMPKTELEETAERHLEETPKGRGNVIKALVELCCANYKIGYAKQSLFDCFATWYWEGALPEETTLVEIYHNIIDDTKVYESYTNWRDRLTKLVDGEICQSVPHKYQLKKQQRPEGAPFPRDFGWRVIKDTKNTTYNSYTLAMRRVLELVDEGVDIKVAVAEH